MKKLFSGLLVMFLITLTGCGEKTDYDQLVKDVDGIKSMQYAMMEVAVSSDVFDFSYLVEMNLPNETVHISVLGMDFYVDQENVYVQVLGSWYYTSMSTEMKADLEEEFNYLFFTVDMPDGDEQIGSNPTDVEIVDNALAGKTYDEVVVATEDGYTIVGLEEVVTISTDDSFLEIKAIDSEAQLEASVSVGKTEKFEVPTEALEGTEIPTEALEALIEA